MSNLTSIEKNNKDYSAVAIMFRVKLADQEKWNADASMNENTYKNTVVWNGHKDDVDVTVERNKSYLEKKGEQLKKSEDQYLEEVFYQVKINPDGKDLISTADQITLKDTFTTSQGGYSSPAGCSPLQRRWDDTGGRRYPRAHDQDR